MLPAEAELPASPESASPESASPESASPESASPESASPDPMMQVLLIRIQTRPNHSDSWRVLGNYQAKVGNVESARQSLEKALQIDPENAAAHFDYGELLLTTGDSAQALQYFDRCISLAPESDYAKRIATSGWIATRNDEITIGKSPVIQQVDYRIQTFDGSEDLDRTFERLKSDADPSHKRIRFFLETGALYNSNVSLTPISRELRNEDAKAFQWLTNPEVEWIAFKRHQLRSGFIARSFLTINESTQDQFDLASLQAGGFVERDFFRFASDWTARLDYIYALDSLDGQRFGDRHSMTASIIQIRPDLDIVYGYFTISTSEFSDDGMTPQTTSLDGPSVSAGLSRFFQTSMYQVPSFALGIDLESVNTDGSDFRYRGVTTYGEWTLQLRDSLQLIPSVGTGYRDYYAFTGLVPRDEWTWRIQAKLCWQAMDHMAISWVAGHDRFASENAEFDAERTQGGMLITVTY
ncbi:tetratricopeptide repeat protein [Rubripirellula sp.]|nr:tetratricopeptide repeat protein [Rubripirellula sp.]